MRTQFEYETSYMASSFEKIALFHFAPCIILPRSPLLTNEALDMMCYRPDNTNIDRGKAEVNIGILWSISHHIQCLNSQ